MVVLDMTYNKKATLEDAEDMVVSAMFSVKSETVEAKLEIKGDEAVMETILGELRARIGHKITVALKPDEQRKLEG